MTGPWLAQLYLRVRDVLMDLCDGTDERCSGPSPIFRDTATGDPVGEGPCPFHVAMGHRMVEKKKAEHLAREAV